MPRGGKREGAGRSATLDLLERLALGAECEARFLANWREASEKLCNEDPRRARLDALRAEAHQIPVAERPAWLRSQAGRDYFADVEGELADMRRAPVPPRLVAAD